MLIIPLISSVILLGFCIGRLFILRNQKNKSIREVKVRIGALVGMVDSYMIFQDPPPQQLKDDKYRLKDLKTREIKNTEYNYWIARVFFYIMIVLAVILMTISFVN